LAAFGFTLDERWGEAAFWCWLIGFYVAFMPLCLMGMTRRMQQTLAVGGDRWCRHHPGRNRLPDRSARRIHPPPQAAPRRDRRSLERPHAGMVDSVAAAGLEFRRPAPVGCEGRLLEQEARRACDTRSAGPGARVPAHRDAEKQRGWLHQRLLCPVTGFGPIWHIWWMASLGVIGAFVTIVIFVFRAEDEIEIPAERIAQFERNHEAELVL
jgi:cytochrome o ubiquinol oxidase subunit I